MAAAPAAELIHTQTRIHTHAHATDLMLVSCMQAAAAKKDDASSDDAKPALSHHDLVNGSGSCTDAVEDDEESCLAEFEAAAADQSAELFGKMMFQFIGMYYSWYHASDTDAKTSHLQCLSDPQFVSLVEIGTAIQASYVLDLGLEKQNSGRLFHSVCNSSNAETWFSLHAMHDMKSFAYIPYTVPTGMLSVGQNCPKHCLMN